MIRCKDCGGTEFDKLMKVERYKEETIPPAGTFYIGRYHSWWMSDEGYLYQCRKCKRVFKTDIDIETGDKEV